MEGLDLPQGQDSAEAPKADIGLIPAKRQWIQESLTLLSCVHHDHSWIPRTMDSAQHRGDWKVWLSRSHACNAQPQGVWLTLVSLSLSPGTGSSCPEQRLREALVLGSYGLGEVCSTASVQWSLRKLNVVFIVRLDWFSGDCL